MVFYIATMVSQLVFALYYCFGFDLLNSRYNLTVPGARTFSVSGDRIIIRKTEPGADVFGFIFSPKEWGGGTLRPHQKDCRGATSFKIVCLECRV